MVRNSPEAIFAEERIWQTREPINRGVIEDNDLHIAASTLDEKEYLISKEVASAWEHCQIDEEG